MSITNYTELQASLAAWLHRTDLAAVIPDFITLAETRMNGTLESRNMEARVTLTCVPSVRTVAFPSDLMDMKRLAVIDADPVQVLQYKSPDQLIEDSAYLAATSRPTCFTVVGSTVELAPTPDKAYALELLYQQRIPALSVSNPSNWVLAQNPNIYLFGALMSSAGYTQDESLHALWEKKYLAAAEVINSVDWYTGSTMRVKTR